MLKPLPTCSCATSREFKQNQKRQINQVLSFVLALLVLSLVIAVLGIVNTLALSVFERTREIGLLRAVGMGTQQVRRMIRLEAVVIAVFGALLGVALGHRLRRSPGPGTALARRDPDVVPLRTADRLPRHRRHRRHHRRVVAGPPRVPAQCAQRDRHRLAPRWLRRSSALWRARLTPNVAVN